MLMVRQHFNKYTNNHKNTNGLNKIGCVVEEELHTEQSTSGRRQSFALYGCTVFDSVMVCTYRTMGHFLRCLCVCVDVLLGSLYIERMHTAFYGPESRALFLSLTSGPFIIKRKRSSSDICLSLFVSVHI